MNEIIVKHYRLLHPLGQGGSGITYLAIDTRNDKKVVVKQFHRAAGDSNSWEREGELLRSLQHPNIPRIIDSFVHKVLMVPRPHLVQEFIDGSSLKQEMKLTRGSIQDALKTSAELLEILSYLQSVNPPVIHRDIKPGNIIRREFDQSLCLIDFGSAISAESRTFGHTLAVGTLGYQAPEQIAGDPLPSSDVYAIGVILVERLTGIAPSKLLVGQSLNWRPKLRHLEAEIIQWLSRSLAADPDQRFNSAADALDALYRLSPFLKRKPIPKPSFQLKGSKRLLNRQSKRSSNTISDGLDADILLEQLESANLKGDFQKQEDILAQYLNCFTNLDVSQQLTAVYNAALIVGESASLKRWLRRLEEQLADPADMSKAIDLWRLMGRPDLETFAESRREQWISNEFRQMEKRFKSAGLRPNMPKPPYTVQELNDWRSLERRWLNRVDEILNQDSPIDDRISNINRLKQSLGTNGISLLLNAFCDRLSKTIDLRAMAAYFKEMGDIEMKDKLLKRRQELLGRERESLEQRLNMIAVHLPSPSGTLSESIIHRFEDRVVEQEKRSKQVSSLDKEVKRLRMSPVSWRKPYSATAIQTVQDNVEAHANRLMTINRIQVEARRISWPIEIPSPPYSQTIIESLDSELKRQSARHRVLSELQDNCIAVMDWGPLIPEAPYTTEQVEEYRDLTDLQLSHHRSIEGLWRRLGHSGRKLLTLPKPPYSFDTVEEFTSLATPFLNDANARRTLGLRRIKALASVLVFILTPIILWQLSLQSTVNRLALKADSYGFSVPLVDVNCDKEMRRSDMCVGTQLPTLPFSTAEVDAFENALSMNIALKRRMDSLKGKAKDMSIDLESWRMPYYRDQLIYREGLIERRKQSLNDLEALKERANALGMNTQNWSGWRTEDDLSQLRNQITLSELLKSQVESLHGKVVDMGLKPIKISPPYRQSHLDELQHRVYAAPEIKTIFAKQSIAYLKGGLTLSDKWHFASRPFAAMANEVNQKMFMRVMRLNPSQTPCEDCPVERIRFRDAIEYANRLSWSLGLDECYLLKRDEVIWKGGQSCNGWRLPNVSEWKHLAANKANPLSIDNNINLSHPTKALTIMETESGVSEMVWVGQHEASGDPIIRTPSSPSSTILALGHCGVLDDIGIENRDSFDFLTGTRDPCVGIRLVRTLSDKENQLLGISIPEQPPLVELNLLRDADLQTAKGKQYLDIGDLHNAHASFSMAQLSKPDHNPSRLGLAKTLRLEMMALEEPSAIASKRQMARDLLCQILLDAKDNETLYAAAIAELKYVGDSCNHGEP